MITFSTRKEAKDLMKKIGLIKDDYPGERGRTYFKLPGEGVCCQSTIDKIGLTFYVCLYGQHAKIAALMGIK